ncbi:MAG TPA: bifunctional oligoribonuclease/PAP phosphatase NrnA [Nitrospirae bacterium]|nr:bifunctional oligoribonuclease and PAP phosphatase NrnA [bacterium BMS3Bbin08]HDO25172.1 bifunctional oligoribonuclease/PAP phosphatase NrnA [Nitrospirota bacterium]
MKVPVSLLKLIKENRRFLIVSHINPDGDAAGSVIALAMGLKKLGKSVYALCKDPVPHIYRFLPGSDLIKSRVPSSKFDAVLLLDCNSFKRTGFKELQAEAIGVIDHHLTAGKDPWRVNFLDPDVSATAELVYALLKALRVPIDKKMALNLYTAIFTDTGGFRYSNTNVKTLEIASELMKKGVNAWEISKEVYESYPYKRQKLLILVLATLEKRGRIASVTVTRNMYKKTNTTAEDTEDFVNHARKIKGVEVGILFRETGKNKYKISLRSKGSIDVANVAKGFGGGGHASAAGLTVDGTLKEVKSRVFKAVRKAIKE